MSEEEKYQKITRLGVYGLVIDAGKMLLVRQKKGPYADKFDFPGGGIEFGESPEQTIRRELVEEIAMEFDSLQLIDNLTATVHVPLTSANQASTFFHVGMIYKLNGCRSLSKQAVQELQHFWIDPKTLSKEECSSLLWKYILFHLKKNDK